VICLPSGDPLSAPASPHRRSSAHKRVRTDQRSQRSERGGVPLQDLMVCIFSSSTMMEIRCVISPASRKRFMLPSRGARAGAPWEARGQGQVRSLRATTGESSRRPPALTRSARAPHQRIRLCSWRRPALRSSAWCGLLVSSKSPVVRSERSSGMAFVLVLIALNLAKPFGPQRQAFLLSCKRKFAVFGVCA